jgi:hypothetical protein
MLTSARRVERNTSDSLNRAIRQEIEASVRYHERNPGRIDDRLEELDHEWDIERTLEANAATLALSGALLGLFVDRRWTALPAVVSAFLLQHAVQGWCPPLPVLRRMGFRTPREINTERMALKALRGDFEGLRPASGERDTRASHALQAVRL